MQIDLRELESKQLLRMVRDILASQSEREADIEALISSASEAKKVEAFVLMSGYRTEIKKKTNTI